jgi:hypothetical protein
MIHTEYSKKFICLDMISAGDTKYIALLFSTRLAMIEALSTPLEMQTDDAI